MDKLKVIEEVLNKYNYTIKMNNTDYIGSSAVFDILVSIWYELKEEDRNSIVDALI